LQFFVDSEVAKEGFAAIFCTVLSESTDMVRKWQQAIHILVKMI